MFRNCTTRGMTCVTIEELQGVADGGNWPPENAWLLAQELLEHFGSPDPKLRDTLSYTMMERLVSERLLNLEEQLVLLKTALDDHHLYAGIGETETDSVFLRSFSVLVVPIILGEDLDEGRLSESVVVDTLDRVFDYARAERDWRGYVVDKGWAHAVAHTADALGVVARHPRMPIHRLSEVFSTIQYLATLPYPLGYLEDDRLAYAAYQIIESGRVSTSMLDKWLNRFQRLVGPDDGVETLGGANAEHVLRSLYFRFRAKDTAHPYLDAIQKALDRFDIFLPEASTDDDA